MGITCKPIGPLGKILAKTKAEEQKKADAARKAKANNKAKAGKAKTEKKENK